MTIHNNSSRANARATLLVPHKEKCLVASGLFRIFDSGASLTTMIGCTAKYCHNFRAVVSPHGRRQLTRVNSTNVLDEGLRIGGRGRQMNSKVKISQTRRGYAWTKNKCGTQLAQSQSVPGRPLLAPIYRWPGLKDSVGFNTNYSVRIRDDIVISTMSMTGPILTGLRGTKIMGSTGYTLITR
jgi:hypothetical protein